MEKENQKKSKGSGHLIIGILLLILGLNNLISGEAFVAGAGAEGAGYNMVTIIILAGGSYLLWKGYKLHKQ